MRTKHRRRVDKRGQPRRASARRRATTVAGRSASPDDGTPQLRARKRQATTRTDLEISGAGVLYGRGHLDAKQYGVLATVTLWLERLQRSWGGAGGVTGLWHSILGAAVPAGFGDPRTRLHRVWPTAPDGASCALVSSSMAAEIS